MKKWQEKQRVQLKRLGLSHNANKQFVFHNRKNSYIDPTKTIGWINAIQKKYKLKRITTHGLRHTHCSLLFEAGCTLKEVQDRLGHEDIQTTMNIYAHVSNKSRNDVSEKFFKFMDD